MIGWINKKRNQKGFTLIELVVVIAILGILAAIAIPRFTSQTQKAKEIADQATARNIIGALNVAIANGDATISTAGVKFSGASSESTDIIGDLVTKNLLDAVGKPESNTSGTFTVNVNSTTAAVTVTDGASLTFYPVQ